MVMLSPKARRFISIAIDGIDDDLVKAVWHAVDKDTAGDLPDAAARAALVALRRLESRVRDKLDNLAIGEDETADLSNDLGLICAIEGDLMRQVGHAS